MTSLTHILRQYESAFRDLITFKNWSTDKNVREALRLHKEEDWSFICSSLDVIGDTTCAIQHFLETGLEGLSEDTGVGEKYLRLYGVLNLTYLQQEAIGVLYQKIINPNYTKKDRGKLFDGLSIRKIRNKIGSHSSDYNHGNESYVVIRHTLSKYSFEFMNNYSLKKDRVNLKECLEKHLILIIKLFDELYERSINTLYKNNPRLKEELDKLSYLRKMKEKHIN